MDFDIRFVCGRMEQGLRGISAGDHESTFALDDDERGQYYFEETKPRSTGSPGPSRGPSGAWAIYLYL